MNVAFLRHFCLYSGDKDVVRDTTGLLPSIPTMKSRLDLGQILCLLNRPYTKPVTQIFTVPELPMEYTQAAWHCIGMWPLRK
ncbi:uncharacterized protein LOC124136476 isoform X2 [Haliotis rufescens]|uniref:uncharacterized protein LOC124136476 isoform X2 n=1 Tax=Haliotis rufescens TaxID=6454 RepID=UPI001EAFF2C3|nr:uncharacterized protein LOC124136476 isoform X2 [Haliotis rufescens]